MWIKRIFKLLVFDLSIFGIGIYTGKDFLDQTELWIFLKHICLFIVGVFDYMISNSPKLLRVVIDEISWINVISVGRIKEILSIDEFLCIAFNFLIGFKQVRKSFTKF